MLSVKKIAVIFIILALLGLAVFLFFWIKKRPAEPEVKSVSVGPLTSFAQRATEEKDTILFRTRTVLDEAVKDTANNVIKVVDTTLGGSVTVQKGRNYTLNFVNFPADLCLYAKGQGQKFLDGETVQIEPSPSGAFPLTVDFCGRDR